MLHPDGEMGSQGAAESIRTAASWSTELDHCESRGGIHLGGVWKIEGCEVKGAEPCSAVV